MISLLLLALFYLFAAVALILVIDRFVGLMFPASTKKSPVAVRPPLRDSSN